VPDLLFVICFQFLGILGGEGEKVKIKFPLDGSYITINDTVL